MIVYSATKSEFRDDVRANRIEASILTAFRRTFGHGTQASEIESWKNSMLYMSNVLEDDGIPADAGVAIEYSIPQTSKRIDFILTGRNPEGTGAAVIVELKQWSKAEATNMDAIVSTVVAGAKREMTHPSYQAWTYALTLEYYNEAVQKLPVSLHPCAYLHNMTSAATIHDPRYAECLAQAPAFLRNDAQKLTDFIKKHISKGDGGRLMFEIDKGRIRPSKNLVDQLESMLAGNLEFVMIDDQKLVFETAMQQALEASPKDKRVLIVEGGPGTGKSVVAINLLVRLTAEKLVTQYVTRNAAPRAVYSEVLAGKVKKARISLLFRGSGAFVEARKNTFDTLIVDEAHRLNEKSGMYQNEGENQVKEIIHATKCSIFFLDEDQRIAWKDIGSADEIEKWARKAGATVTRAELRSQFRCNGSDGYLAWLDHVLQLRETANEDLEGIDYDIRLFDTPNGLMDAIVERNQERNRARVVAGYCWDWISKKAERKHEFDIVFEEHGFRKQWNLDEDGSLWIRRPDSVHQVGCIHTCQGLECDYIGVIIGPDLVVRDGRVVTQPKARSKMDSTMKGFGKETKTDPAAAAAKADLIIKNTYRTLMSRGQKGCYIHCTDPETAAYFAAAAPAPKQAAKAPPLRSVATISPAPRYPGLNLRVVGTDEAQELENCVPIFDLAIAAGGFRSGYAEECDRVQLPDGMEARENLFVAQVVGRSMDRRIPDGAWCLFRANPSGSRNGKIVVVQHWTIQDPDTGGSWTIKRYRSEKTATDVGWRHGRIILSPESWSDEYADITFDEDAAGELRVVAELVSIFG
jgi:uncharacterized protein